MSRVYGADERGDRLLLRLTCDADGCANTVKPNPGIASSGWKCYGEDSGIGTTKLDWDYCPDHAIDAWKAGAK